jgi:hypothetical protein
MSWIDFLDVTCGGERLREAKLRRLNQEAAVKKVSTQRIEDERIIIEALAERHADDIWLVDCPDCGVPSYWNQGSHATCRKCDADLSDLTDDAYTLADYWEWSPYPCDAQGERGER